jgi:hypothetical protein
LHSCLLRPLVTPSSCIVIRQNILLLGCSSKYDREGRVVGFRVMVYQDMSIFQTSQSVQSMRTRTFGRTWTQKPAAARRNATKAKTTTAKDIDRDNFFRIFIMAGIAGFVTKALSPSYYGAQWKNFLVKSHAYYHPKFRAGR